MDTNGSERLFALGLDLAREEEEELRACGWAFLTAMAEHFEETYHGIEVVQGYSLGLRLIAADLADEAEDALVAVGGWPL